MPNLSDISNIKSILKRHGFTFSKALGQNFIINPSVCPRIAEEGVVPGCGVIEIGPGIGVLTRELASLAKKVVCIELDERLLPILQETLADFDNVQVICADVLKVDLAALIQAEFAGMEVCVCANLPYYITSPILMGLLEARLPITAITVMVQKEAGKRICAPEGSRDAGAITYAVRYYSNPTVLFDVTHDSFLPAPEVDSSVIRLDILSTPPILVANEAHFFATVRGAFCQRRKTIANSLCAALCKDKPTVLAALEEAKIPSNARPEQLTLAQFARICELL